jgi:hypothetical protein
MHALRRAVVPLVTLTLGTVAPLVWAAPALAAGKAAPKITVVVSGLHNPRGITFGPGGALYVAEAGLGGSRTSVGHCTQVPNLGPYTGGFTARISRVNVHTGQRTTVASGLPSSQTNPQTGSDVLGVADVEFLGGTLYALTAGAGCSHGLVGTNNGIRRVNLATGATTLIANLSAFQKAHPTKVIEPDDFEPDGTWYSMTVRDGALFAVEPNHGEVDRITASGNISRLIDVSATQGHAVPTALVATPTGFLLGNLNTFDPGSATHAKVWRISPTGHLTLVRSGLTAVTGVALHDGTIYALEAFTGSDVPSPAVANSGTVVRLGADGNWHPVVTGLSFPTAMSFGPDNALYVSNRGFGQPTNTAGQIVRIDLHLRS